MYCYVGATHASPMKECGFEDVGSIHASTEKECGFEIVVGANG